MIKNILLAKGFLMGLVLVSLLHAEVFSQCVISSTADVTGCTAGNTYTLSVASQNPVVTDHIWYTSETGPGTVAYSGKLYPLGQANGYLETYLQIPFIATTSYWVAAVCASGISPRVKVTFTLYDTNTPNLTILSSALPWQACPGFTLTASATNGSNYLWYLGDPATRNSSFLGYGTTYTPTQSGIYYLIGTIATPCGNINQTTSISVTYTPKPTSPVISNVTVGYNTATLLSVNATGNTESFSWYDANQNYLQYAIQLPVTLTQITRFYIARNIGACYSDKVPFSVTVDQLPQASAGPDIQAKLPVNSIQLTGSGSDPEGPVTSYYWEKISGPSATLSNTYTSNLSCIPSSAGVYVLRLSVTDSFGQTSVDDVTVTVTDPAAAVNNYTYVREENIPVAGITDATTLASASKNISTTYYDDIGKPMQKIGVHASVTGKDIVAPIVYDDLGRNAKNYLPVVASASNGLFKQVLDVNGLYSGDLATFYPDLPYAVTTYEPSPLSRVTEQGSTGRAWQPGSSSGTNKAMYGTNAINDVRIWTINSSTGLPVSTATWAANQLQVTTSTTNVTDQLQQVTQVYKSIDGLTMLERTKADGTNWAETYYVYDTWNNLRFIIPPELCKALKAANNYTPTPDQVNRWCFQYNYDDLHRVVESKGPGTDWVYNVYDLHNLRLTQDGNQRTRNEWSFVKYDPLERVISTGIYRPAVIYSRTDLQGVMNGTVQTPSSTTEVGMDIVSSSPGNFTQFTADNSIKLEPGFDFAATLSKSFDGAINTAVIQTAATFPSSDNEDLTYTYYDTYTGNAFFTDPAFQFTAETWVTSPSGFIPFTKFDRVRSKVTGTSVKILNTTQWLNTVVYYDQYQSPIQTISSLHTGGVGRISSIHDFTGHVVESKSTKAGQVIARRSVYDQAGRLLTVYHRINSQPEVILSSLTYNELNEVTSKKIHSTDNGSTFLQSIDYTYNLHGAVTAINSATPATSGESDYFALEMSYETDAFTSSSIPRKDGFITSAKWRHDLTSNQKIYNYDYDPLGRLANANYKAGITNGAWTSESDFYSEKALTYDYNGNLKNLTRYADTLVTANVIDNLTYDYSTAGGNQLMAVTDNSTTVVKRRGLNDRNTSGADYAYDANGNLTQDKNKGITSITYNYLNLPDRITFADNSYLQNKYSARGEKLNATYFTGAGQQIYKTDYVDDFIFVNDALSIIQTEEGRIIQPSYTNLIANRDANSLSDFVNNGSVNRTPMIINSQNYVRAICNQTTGTPGLYPIGQTYYSVKAGESYSFKVLGYQTPGTTATLYAWTDAGVITLPVLTLPVGAANETWTTATFVIPAGATQLKVGVLWTTPVINSTFYINQVALYKTDFEYQYFLTDHLGNTRAVVSSAPAAITYTATMESENFQDENSKFQNMKLGQENSAFPAANSTLGGSKAILLNSSYPVGPAKSLKVYPGDKIDASTYSYYPSGLTYTKAPLTTIITAVAMALTGGPGLVDGITKAYNHTASSLFALSPSEGPAQPSAFLNYILFDKNYVPLEAKSIPIVTTAGSHQRVTMPTVNVKEVGILYIYLSYDNNESTDWVYFDDLKIVHQESPLIQVNDYYPYGMTAYSWVREGEQRNMYLYQGKEYDSLTRTADFDARVYDASIGRWFATDPAGQFANPYLAMGNNPVMYTDPNGEFAFIPIIIGAIIGAYSGGTIANHGEMNPGKWDYNSGKTWGYMVGGAVVGGVSGGIGAEIATSGIPFANTAGIAAGSAINSLGTYAYTGGQTDISVSLGFASYDFTTQDLGYLGENGNTTLDNIGYGLGALANLKDVNDLINKTKANLYTQVRNADGSKDVISHSGIVDDTSGEKLMSFGPDDSKIGGGGFKDQIGGIKPGGGYKKFALAIRKGTSDYPVPVALSKATSVTVNKYLFRFLKGFSKIVPYQGCTTNCVNMSSLGLWLNGIPNIGIHPFLLNYSMMAYNSGFRPDLFSYYLNR